MNRWTALILISLALVVHLLSGCSSSPKNRSRAKPKRPRKSAQVLQVETVSTFKTPLTWDNFKRPGQNQN